jgi:hypothetical protein
VSYCLVLSVCSERESERHCDSTQFIKICMYILKKCSNFVFYLLFGASYTPSFAHSIHASPGKKLFNATVEAINAGIAVCAPGRCLTEIGAAIEDVTDKHNFSSVREYCGHGIGSYFHMPPLVQHYRNKMKLTLQPVSIHNLVFVCVCAGICTCIFVFIILERVEEGGGGGITHSLLIVTLCLLSRVWCSRSNQ